MRLSNDRLSLTYVAAGYCDGHIVGRSTPTLNYHLGYHILAYGIGTHD